MSAPAGEAALGIDPAAEALAGVTAIGRIRSAWAAGDCPRNLRQARARGGGAARLEIDAPYRPSLRGLSEGQWIWLLAWYGDKRRDLIVQAPARADGPRGTFALRSPVRPNPVTLQLVRITALDEDRGPVAGPGAGLPGVQMDALTRQRSPQPLDADAVETAPRAVREARHARPAEPVRPGQSNRRSGNPDQDGSGVLTEPTRCRPWCRRPIFPRSRHGRRGRAGPPQARVFFAVPSSPPRSARNRRFREHPLSP